MLFNRKLAKLYNNFSLLGCIKKSTWLLRLSTILIGQLPISSLLCVVCVGITIKAAAVQNYLAMGSARHQIKSWYYYINAVTFFMLKLIKLLRQLLRKFGEWAKIAWAQFWFIVKSSRPTHWVLAATGQACDIWSDRRSFTCGSR